LTVEKKTKKKRTKKRKKNDVFKKKELSLGLSGFFCTFHLQQATNNNLQLSLEIFLIS